ncbi:Alpha-glucosidase, glycosyl hydrolase family GH31 [Catalinimonas alkaloidigena]|uniref:Alpha-glucosidase, glycosyl hydrolase family GH31 n=1 Tax=Catalinimonas alkaloidigena TaxID=1075417 RepID=A0A1G9SVD8_9BACT|nr:TIM-barrel domain-containing protein [Catalinimonas alkaloidigena]SDM39317.1 Alpha-glucosidase, glycosyl hydrolase family GH31 [Catalinimonas alkaloidigena]
MYFATSLVYTLTRFVAPRRGRRLGCIGLVLLLSTAGGPGAQAQTAVGAYRSGFKHEGNVVSFTTTEARVRLEFCTPGVVRVRTSWNDTFAENEPWMVVRYDWPPVAVQATEETERFVLTSAQLRITVQKSPFRIDVATAEGSPLLLESGTAGATQEADTVACRKQLGADEHFFGFGERMDFLDRRGRKTRLNVGRGQGLPHIVGAYNVLEANYAPVPFFMSTRGYGLFFHTAYATNWDMGATDPNQLQFGAEGGELDYYVLYGPTFPQLLDHYTDLTGKAPLLPKFALGLHVGTYSGGTWGHEELTSDQYVVALARRFRQLGIPIDVLHLDSTWRLFGKNGGKGATTFEWRETFQHPEAMFDSLYALHLNAVGLHLRPRFDNGRTMNLLAMAQEKGFTYPEEDNPGEFVNFFDSSAVNWWWDHGVMKIASQGAMFLKTDEGSAFGHLANESEKVGPTGEEVKRLHNLFPLAYAKAPYEKFQAYNGIRGMNHTREGYAGIQRYPFIFAGDWPSEWQYFEPVIRAGLNIGLSGVGHWAHCMGGFEHNADPELYIRWCQFGLLSPVAHLFGMDHPGYKEPWNYGEEALRIFKQYDAFRYRLIPYLYSYTYEMHKTGLPLMRALVLDYQYDPNVYELTDQYLLGRDMMICPVTEKGAQTRVVYLPEGTWFNYWTGQRYEGKRYLNVVTPLDTLPIFVRAGAVIPQQPVVQYVGEKPLDELTVELFPGEAASTFTLYQDDGKSLEYQNGAYALSTFRLVPEGAGLRLILASPEGAYRPSPFAYRAKIHTDRAPQELREGKKKLPSVASLGDLDNGPGWYYDADQHVLWIKPKGKSNATVEVVVR